MPDYKNCGERDFSCFDNMTDEELEEILRLDAIKQEGEESDIDMLLYVMEVLAERGREKKTIKSPEEAFAEFTKHYLPCLEEENDTDRPEKVRHQKKAGRPAWKRALTAVAATIAVVFLGTVTSNALGYDVWGTLFGWTEQTFHFADPSEPEQSVGSFALQENMTFDSLQEALDFLGITYDLVPEWMPEGYALKDIFVDQMPKQVSVLAYYCKGEEVIEIFIASRVSGNPEQIEAEVGKCEVYYEEDVPYYVLQDVDQVKAAWTAGNYECYIAGDVSVEDLKTMIRSIGG